MKLSYNSPVVLGYCLTCLAVLALGALLGHGFVLQFFSTAPLHAPGSGLKYLALFSHVLGHRDLDHLLSNTVMILLIGPALEEKYGPKTLILMIAACALATGLFNALASSYSVYGASGVVFMMIVLASFSGARAGELPLTFVLVALIYLGREAILIFSGDNVSRVSHLIGGAAGAAFGSLFARAR
jgi:membrane associated rhomboid family serine protease